MQDLDERKRKILKAIIQTYLETGEPVGSRTISKYTDLNLSSATIRNEMSDLEVIEGKDLCTLVTCTPYGINTHRLLVRGHRTKYVEEKVEEQKEVQTKKMDTRLLIAGAAGAVILAVIIIAVVIRRRKRRRN